MLKTFETDQKGSRRKIQEMGKVGLERHLIACEQEDQNIDPYSPSKFWVGVVAHL